MASKQKWQEKLFGKKLIKCDNDHELVESSNCFKNCEYFGIYFSFANISSESDEITKNLVSLYNRVNNEKCNNEIKRLEVVQIVLWANNDVYGDFEESHRESLMDLPWFAVPFSEIQLKTRLSRRFCIKVGVPTLVLLDTDGSIITCCGTERLMEDPHGDSFPWKPRPVEQVLKDVTLLRGRTYSSEHPEGPHGDITYQDLPSGAIRGFYFSANWCPPCRAFTPQLVDTYRLLRKKEPGFEIIFVSSDRSVESFSIYIENMPWLCIPWQQAAVRAELAQLYGVRGIPTLLLLDGNGHVITHDARTELTEDPLAQNFPWKPRPVNILTERFATKLHDYPAVVLFIEGDETELQFAESVVTPAANSYYQKNNINFNTPPEDFIYAFEDDHYIQFLIGLDSDTSDILREFVGLDDLVPLLVALDIPNNRFAVMDYGTEISIESVNEFLDKFQKGNLEFRIINIRNNSNDVENNTSSN